MDSPSMRAIIWPTQAWIPAPNPTWPTTLRRISKLFARYKASSALMKQTVEKLSLDDMIALAAYVGSLEP